MASSSTEKAKGKRIRNEYEDDDSGKPKKLPRTLVEKDSEKRLILILENASLETIKVMMQTCYTETTQASIM